MSQQPTQFSAAPPPRKSGWKWIIIGLLVGGGGLALLCCGGFGLVGWTTYSFFKAPMSAAIAALEDDDLVSEKLGSPITSPSPVGVTNIQNNNGNGSADVQFQAVGTKGTAEISGRMKLVASKWSIDNLLVTCDDGTKYLSSGGAFVPVQSQTGSPIGEEVR